MTDGPGAHRAEAWVEADAVRARSVPRRWRGPLAVSVIVMLLAAPSLVVALGYGENEISVDSLQADQTGVSVPIWLPDGRQRIDWVEVENVGIRLESVAFGGTLFRSDGERVPIDEPLELAGTAPGDGASLQLTWSMDCVAVDDAVRIQVGYSTERVGPDAHRVRTDLFRLSDWVDGDGFDDRCAARLRALRGRLG